MRKVLLATSIVAGGVCLLAAPAGAVPAPIVVTQIVRGDPGSVHVVGTDTVDPGDVGKSCNVTVIGGNNASVHPNTDILVDSGTDQSVAPDVERDADGIINTAGTLTLGSTITVSVRLGADGVFSGGFTVTFACPTPPPPPPTTVGPQTTTTEPQTTTTGAQDTTTTTGTGASVLAEEVTPGSGSSSGSGSLPNTGFNPLVPVVIGGASVAAGIALISEARRRRMRQAD